MLDDRVYADQVEKVANTFKPDIMDLLTEIGTAWEDEGLSVRCGPYDDSADDYRYGLGLTTGGNPDDIVDIAIEIPEQRSYEGSGDGISFGLTVTEYGGRVIAVRQPHNFTDDVWVDIRDADAIERRWEEMRDWVQRDIPELIHQIRTKSYEGPLPGIL